MTRTPLAPIGAVLAIAVCVAAAPALAAIEGSMATYVNARYGYSISYPIKVFQPQPESENGDGRVFKSFRAGAEFRVWANYAGQSMTPAQLAEMIEADCLGRHASYRIARKTIVVVSCETKDGVLYEKELIRNGEVTGFAMTYPTTESSYWGPVVTAIAESLRPGKG
jgi:hypothetical protein